jgi:hypothetical protein
MANIRNTNNHTNARQAFEKMPHFWKEDETMTESALERLILLSHA